MITNEDIVGFEYFDEGKESLRDPNTYLNCTPLTMVKHFANIYGQTLNHPWMKDTDKDLLRLVLVKEEYAEVLSAVEAEDLLKELADLVYVTYGYAATFGWNLDEAVRRVHASNMSKLDDDGKPIYREDGKVLKGPHYEAPDLTDLV
jgi:predicted HAD superfamily Cof-like phosphohydrolase